MDSFCYLCSTFVFIMLSGLFTCWERADLLFLFCVMFSCVFVTSPHGVSDQVWYMIVSIPDLCLLHYLEKCYFQPFYLMTTTFVYLYLKIEYFSLVFCAQYRFADKDPLML